MTADQAPAPPPVVLVTGASRGIGAATAVCLGPLGARVALAGRRRDALEATASAIADAGGAASVHAVDLAGPGEAAALVEGVVAAHGRLDGVVSNAADIRPIATVAGSAEEDWRHAVDVNLLAPVGLVRAALPALRSTHGRIVLVGSTAATRPIRALGAYCVTKAALRHLAAVVAVEEPDVTVISLLPGRTDTAMHGAIREEGGGAMTASQAAEFHRLKDAGELAPPEVPGRVLAWLALHGPHAWSGREIDRRDPDVRRPADEAFGVPSVDH